MISPIQLTPGMDQGTRDTIINNNFKQVEADSITRIVKDENGDDRILIGRRPDGSYGIDYSLPGEDVLNATDDQLGMSSRFNMYKILAAGELDLLPRDESITLNSTNVAYYCHAVVDLEEVLGDSATDSNIMINVTSGFVNESGTAIGWRQPFKDSGLYFNDGTNEVMYNFDYKLESGRLILTLRLRRTAGSYTFNPISLWRHVWWEVCNTTQGTSVGGGGGSGDGVYFYLDVLFYDADGNQTDPMESSLQESTGEFWKRTPRVFWNQIYPTP